LKEIKIMSKKESVILVPCAGRIAEGIPKNHAVKAVRYIGDQKDAETQYIPMNEAQELYPSATVSTSHGICPKCKRMIRGN
jgi:hypothetical protein